MGKARASQEAVNDQCNNLRIIELWICDRKANLKPSWRRMPNRQSAGLSCRFGKAFIVGDDVSEDPRWQSKSARSLMVLESGYRSPPTLGCLLRLSCNPPRRPSRSGRSERFCNSRIRWKDY